MRLEKVIKGLGSCLNGPMKCESCPYNNDGETVPKCVAKLRIDALELLKEREPVEAVADGEDSYVCNNCGTVIGWDELGHDGIEEVKYKFCPECGRVVKWDD